jgi:hypothetical protein
MVNLKLQVLLDFHQVWLSLQILTHPQHYPVYHSARS